MESKPIENGTLQNSILNCNLTEGETLQNSILNLQRKYFLDIKQTPKTMTSVTELFLRNLDEIKPQGFEKPELRQEVRRVLTESFKELKEEKKSVNFKNLISKLVEKCEDTPISKLVEKREDTNKKLRGKGKNKNYRSITEIMKEFAEKIDCDMVPISFVGNLEEEIVKKKAKNFLCVLGTFLTKKLNEIIRKEFSNQKPLQQQYIISNIQKKLGEVPVEEMNNEQLKGIIVELLKNKYFTGEKEIDYEEKENVIEDVEGLIKKYEEEEKNNLESLSEYYELLLNDSVKYKVKTYFEEIIKKHETEMKELPKSVDTRDLVEKIEKKLSEITSGDYELAPITFSRIIYRLIQKNSLLKEKDKFSKEEIGFLKSLDEKNRDDFLNKVEKKVKSHTQELLNAIGEYKDGKKQPTGEQIDKIIKKLDDFSIIGVNPAFLKKEDIDAFFQFMEKVTYNYINDYESKSWKIPKLIDILVKNFMYDYNPKEERKDKSKEEIDPKEENDVDEKDKIKKEKIRKDIHEKAIPIIANLVNEYLKKHEVINDSTFIRNLVFLTDYCKLLKHGTEESAGIEANEIYYKKFSQQIIQPEERPIDEKLKGCLGLDKGFYYIPEYPFFVEPRIGYKKVEGKDEIHSVAAITAFQMNIDVLVTKNDNIFGDLVEIEGPTHYLYGFGEMGDEFLHPQTIIRNKIRDSMHKLEYKHPVTLKKFAELLKESETLKEKANELKKAKEKLTETRKKFNKYQPINFCEFPYDIHVNAFFRTLSVFRENINIKDFIENKKEIELVEQKLKGLSEKQKKRAESITASQPQRTSLCIGSSK